MGVCGELFLAVDRLSAGFALVLLGTAAFGLAACGRVGPLELPPGPAAGTSPTASAPPPSAAPAASLRAPGANGPLTQEAAQKNGFDAYGNPVAPAGAKKPFLLDFLLQ